MIDVGAGDSRFVDHLLGRGVRCITVLDVSAAALDRAKARLGERQAEVTWIVADVTGDWTEPCADLWHDRAAFHFLTDPEDRRRYVGHLKRAVKPGGTVIIATFAPDGPEKCSGLQVARYSPETLAQTLGPEFRVREGIREQHQTPFGTTQAFWYTRFVFGPPQMPHAASPGAPPF